MMEHFLSLTAKSLLFAGITLLILKAMRNRSAADRSWIAHLGLAAIAILPLAWLFLPQLEVATTLVDPQPVAQPTASASAAEVAAPAATFPGAEPAGPLAGIDWAFWAYALPAGLFLLLTLIALGRLMVLQARANVLVEPNWLTALARAQRRMGFKHGTALLVSDELSSPISWGVMRPVILLSSEAAEAHGEAEAIIAHELAHVARLDWVKLLLSRVTVALFWFNPVVWLLAREAHQLREEAADDAVLASNIEDTDYARLLVGIARHECRGLLIGAHGVAPGRGSLARRVQRVLDAALARAPGGWRWATAAGFFAAGMAVPLAVLQLVPTTPVSAASVDKVGGVRAAPAATAAPRSVAMASTDGAVLIRDKDGRTIRVETDRDVDHDRDMDVDVDVDHDVDIDRDHDVDVDPEDRAIARAVAAKAVGATPAYIASLRNAAPHLRLSDDDAVTLAALGVDPSYIRELSRAGLGRLDAEEIAEAKAMHLRADYIRAMQAAGYGRLSLDQLVELRAVGVTPADVARYRRATGRLPSLDQIVELKALGIDPEDIGRDDHR